VERLRGFTGCLIIGVNIKSKVSFIVTREVTGIVPSA
jgi:hypothetical protein